MSDILYSKIRLEVPESLDGEYATITSKSGNIQLVQMFSPYTDVIVPGMEEYNIQAGIITDKKITIGYGQIVKIPIGVFTSLEDMSWTDISELIKNGRFALVVNTGATKTFKINNKTYTAEVVAINDGTGANGLWYPENTVDFITKELYETPVDIYNRTAATNYNKGGFPASTAKNTLNNAIYPLLPSDLRDVIINKAHIYQAGSTTNPSSGWGSNLLPDSTKLWLPTYYEIVGSENATYAIGETAENNKYYALSTKIKSNQEWWLGTPYTQGYTYSWTISSGGYTSTRDTSTGVRVPICFRIG